MVSVLDSGPRGRGSGPGWGHCAVFLDKALQSHCTSLVEMATGEFNSGVNLAMD